MSGPRKNGSGGQKFTVRFWGVRGSVATPGPDTVRYGGNTSCVEIWCGERRIVIDAGTGIRMLGRQMISDGPTEFDLLLSHTHLDHIEGLPFFPPAAAFKPYFNVVVTDVSPREKPLIAR